MFRGGGRSAGRGRGSGGGGGVGRRTGPDIAWDDEPIIPISTKPEPLFPEVHQTTPKPLSPSERSTINHYRRWRDLMRNGPLYTVLGPSDYTDPETGKLNPRAGFDPFNDGMPAYSAKYRRPRRSLPDLGTIPYTLKFFPRELWSTVDPKKTSPEWKRARDLQTSRSGNTRTIISRKRKIDSLLPGDHDDEDGDDEDKPSEVEDEGDHHDEEDEDEDILTSGRKRKGQTKRRKKRRRTNDPTNPVPGQKRGLEPEDDYGAEQDNLDPNRDDGDGEGGDVDGEEVDELVDSEFEEDEDGPEGADDYNAENYFDTGEGGEEFEDGFGGGGGGGGGGDEDYL